MATVSGTFTNFLTEKHTVNMPIHLQSSTFAICLFGVGFNHHPQKLTDRDWIGGCGTLHDDDHQPHHCLLLVSWVKGQTPKIRGFLRWNQNSGQKFPTLTVWNPKREQKKIPGLLVSLLSADLVFIKPRFSPLRTDNPFVACCS